MPSGLKIFYDFSVPLATLQLKQAFGRVNRRKQQQSSVLVFDKRLAGKTYAKKMVSKLGQTYEIDFLPFDEITDQTKTFLG